MILIGNVNLLVQSKNSAFNIFFLACTSSYLKNLDISIDKRISIASKASEDRRSHRETRLEFLKRLGRHLVPFSISIARRLLITNAVHVSRIMEPNYNPLGITLSIYPRYRGLSPTFNPHPLARPRNLLLALVAKRRYRELGLGR